MTIASTLNQMEQAYFFQRCNEEASANNFIGSNTWRAWCSTPKIPNVPSEALKSAFNFLASGLESFLNDEQTITRKTFDKFHESQVESFYKFVRNYRPGIVVEPRASGDFHGFAYNCYCKVVDLAHTHWCFRKRPGSSTVQRAPTDHPELRCCLHVPLDTQVLNGIRAMIRHFQLPHFEVPKGGMGSVRTKDQYCGIQGFIRCQADRIYSTNFVRSRVSPLAFENAWSKGAKGIVLGKV